MDDVVGLTHAYGCGVAIDAPMATIPIRTLQNIARNPNAISSQALEMLRAQPKAGTYVAVSALDNTQRVFGYQKVRDYPFYIFVALGTQDFLGNWYRDLSIALVMLACFTVVTVLYVRLNYKRVQEMVKTQELARHSALLELANTQLERGMTGTVNAISKMMNLRDPYTSGHEWRVGEIAAAIAAEMGLDEPTQRGLRVAGGVHDVGMVNVPAEILFKPGKLSELEYQVIQDHAEQGYDILHDIDFPWPVAEAARQHHERLDGSGYPQGLKKDQILLEARILAVADVVESMASHRPYRMALGIDQALEEIERGSGTNHPDRSPGPQRARLYGAATGAGKGMPRAASTARRRSG